MLPFRLLPGGVWEASPSRAARLLAFSYRNVAYAGVSMDDDNQHANFEPSFRLVPGETDQWEVLTSELGVCGRVRRDSHGRFSVTRDIWEGRWMGGFGSRREAADHLCIIQSEVEAVREDGGEG